MENFVETFNFTLLTRPQLWKIYKASHLTDLLWPYCSAEQLLDELTTNHHLVNYTFARDNYPHCVVLSILGFQPPANPGWNDVPQQQDDLSALVNQFQSFHVTSLDDMEIDSEEELENYTNFPMIRIN